MLLEEEVLQLRVENPELRHLMAQLLQHLVAARQQIAELEQRRDEPPPFLKPNRPKPADPKPRRKKRAPPQPRSAA
jgi:hypothetical protein